MKTYIAIVFVVLATQAYAIAFPHTGTPTTSTSASPTPSVLLPPFRYIIELVKPTHDGLKSFGVIQSPSPVTQGDLWIVNPVGNVPLNGSNSQIFYFLQKEATGAGIVFSLPFFFSDVAFSLSYNSNNSIPQSPVYLSDLIEDPWLVLVDVNVVRMPFDPDNLYFHGIGNGLGGTPEFAPVVFSVDEKKGELWVSTRGKSLSAPTSHVFGFS
jgi:hypothetical protein